MKHTYKMVGFTLAASLLMGACTPIENGVEKADTYAQDKLTSISVPFEWFKKEEAVEKKVEMWREVTAINLPKTDASAKELKKDQEIVEMLEKELVSSVNMNGFLSRTRPSQETFNGFAPPEGDADVFGDILRKIHEVPNQSIGSLTLTGVGHYVMETDEKALFVSMNVLNDTEEFVVYPLLLTLDKDGQVKSVKQVANETTSSSTPTPLSEKSEWHESVHQEFEFVWDDFTSFPPTTDVSSVTKNNVTSWLTTNDVDEPERSAEAVLKWLQTNEGNLSLAKITGYVHTDENASANTRYELAYPVKNSPTLQTVTINYDRGKNKITSIESGSPFGALEEGEMK